jgi:hypothetical protein
VYVFKTNMHIKIYGKLLIVLIFLTKNLLLHFLLPDVRCRTEACWRIEQILCKLIYDCMEVSRLLDSLLFEFRVSPCLFLSFLLRMSAVCLSPCSSLQTSTFQEIDSLSGSDDNSSHYII